MKVLVSGSNGLVGSALAYGLSSAGHSVGRLVRDAKRAAAGDVFWNPASGTIDAKALAAFDAVVHLAGESIASGRWTTAKKERIFSSRVESTQTIAKALAQSPTADRTFVCASAIGIYGNRGSELLDETSPRGRGDFLSDVCQAWEDATAAASQAGVRVVNTRFGVVLSQQGGALAKMLTPFKLGLGGVVGSGQQYMSWVAIDDVVGAIIYALGTPSLSGPVNVVSPNPVTNRDFTKTLGHVISRPTIFPLPAFAARLAFGQMADELLLASQRVQPARLEANGYKFQYSTLAQALRHVLNRP